METLSMTARVLLVLAIVGGLPPPCATARMTGEPGVWPRSQQTTAGTFTVYQPQIDSWDGYTLGFHAAASFQPPPTGDSPDAQSPPVFGVISLTASTLSDRAEGLVYLNDVTIVSADFPAIPQGDNSYKAWFQWLVPPGQKTVPLAQLQADLAVAGAKATRPVVVSNEPPEIIFSERAAVLIAVDGAPVWHLVPGTKLERIVNTRALAVRDPANGWIYVHLLNGWITAQTLAGPWQIAPSFPPQATQVASDLAKAGTVDLMEGSADPTTKQKPTLKTGLPAVFVSIRPTEVITLDGPPDWQQIDQTNLLYVKNTTGNVFRDIQNQVIYVLLSGRWFSASDLKGPWTFVDGQALPPDFAQMPDDSPKENVKACVPGTRQAQEALIAAQMPQSAQVYISKVSFKPRISGVPVLQLIEGTTLFYVMNSPDPIIQVSPELWYAVQNGVWFTSRPR